MSNAPGELEVVRSFLNTVEIGSGSDALSTPDELAAWLLEQSLLEAGAQAGAEDLERSHALRSALRALCSANASGDLDRGAAPVLNAAAERAGLRVRFGEDGGAELESGAEGVDGAHGRLLAIVAASMRAGSWERLKICRSDDCRWAFYDASKNHSRAWCSMSLCGNRAKARSFRERHAGA